MLFHEINYDMNAVPFCQSRSPLYPIAAIEGTVFCGSVSVDIRTTLWIQEIEHLFSR